MSIDRAASVIAARRSSRVEPARPVLPPTGYDQAPPAPADVCPDCYGVGIIVPPGSREAQECPCGAYQRHHVALWGQRSGMPRRHRHHGGFEAYKAATPTQATILARCSQYAEEFSPGTPGMILLGYCGTGKSHLAAAILWRVIERLHTGTWWNVADLFLRLHASYKSEDESADDILHDAMESNLLILDDLGAIKTTDHVADHVNRLLNHRLESQGATIITTNLSKSAIESTLGERIASRILELAPKENRLSMCWNDYRRNGESEGEE